MKILINTPCIKRVGGVANHYLGLMPYWKEEVKYCNIGKRLKTKTGKGWLYLPWDILNFIWYLVSFKPDIVLINPSLSYNALRRDFIFLRIARLFHVKVAVFFHGFNWSVAQKINQRWIVANINKAVVVIVLAKAFKDALRAWGVSVPIELSTTKVDDRLVSDFDINTRTGEGMNLLFLSRVEKEKGIYETIETYRILKHSYPELSLTVAGNGSELSNVRNFIAENKISDVEITGPLSGDKLINTFRKALLLVLISYGEGLPTVVLEGMAFGLPIITRNVGGIPDFFENDKMGFSTDSMNPQVFADAISELLSNKKKLKEIAHYNYYYAKEHFMASTVASSLEKCLKKY